MNKIVLLTLIILIGNVCAIAQTIPYELDWGTYYGNRFNEQQDAVVDAFGNIYILSNIGNSAINDVTNYATPNAHQSDYGGGTRDVLITKLSPQGNLIWATYYG
ncbi:hypothetical protein KO504_04580 [Winogradskyella psychrotolerans]|uniref:hypothetical protein n=1 Tax=Winogradskyella psychrotolerans TaxID=1344585 RepID=UPI001C0711D6|nr:hypothetical protein [Winogradskyella psychrotolerans]MBU2920608.1 hypothetical protein [Winogradskyella psychrotolerans]